MLRYFVILGIALFCCINGCTTADSRRMNNRLVELETRVQRLESGPEFSKNTIPRIPDNFNDIETITPSELNMTRSLPRTR